MIGAAGGLAAFELAALVRRRWFAALVLAGIAEVAIGAAVAATHAGLTRADSYRASSASLLLVGGLALSLALGATTVARGGETGHLGLLVGSGVPRATVAVARMVARVAALAVGLAAWLVALQVGSLALGRGLDGPLAVHVAASAETDAVVLLAAAAVSTVLGPAVAATVAFAVHITAHAVVNLEAAADQGRLGAWTRVAHVVYNLLPRAVLSPMIVDMQNRGQGGPAAPRFEINTIPVPLSAAGVGTVLWMLFWCALLGLLCASGTRRRTL